MIRQTDKYLQDNNGTFRHSRAVPADLIPVIGKKRIDIQFKGDAAKDREAARKENRKATVQTDELFDSLRRELANQPRVQAKVKEILGPLIELKFPGKKAITREDIAALRDELEAQRTLTRFGSVGADAAYLDAFGEMPEFSDGTRFSHVFERGYQDDMARLAAVFDGVNALPLPEAYAKVIEIWRRENTKTPSDSAVTECKRALRYFEMALGEPVPLRALTKQHMRKFRTWLYDYRKSNGEPFAQWSRHKYFGYIKLMLKVASEHDLIDTNPAADIKIPKASIDEREHDKRASYSNQQVQKVIEAAIALIHSKEESDQAHGWITLIGACTGARLGEIAKAAPQRFIERDGYLCLHITGRRTVKTGSSVRFVPLPQLVLDSGFKAYMTEDRMKRTALFDYGKAKSFSSAVSKWASRFLTKLGVKTTKAEVFHSLRHTMKDALRDATPDEELRDRIVGHTSGKVGRTYGNQLMLAQQKRALDDAVNLILRPVKTEGS